MKKLNRKINIKNLLINTHYLNSIIKNDKYKPNYHFTIPFDLGFPADPNACFYYNGKYHLMYIYESRLDSYRWAHVISNDLLHWVRLQDAIIPDEIDGGIYSGGVYLENDKAYITYWALGKNNNSDGIRMATSKGPDFLIWEKVPGYIIKNKELGIAEVNGIEIGSADPSNIFKNNDKYYMQLGNLCLLNKYRDQKDNVNYNRIKGDHSYLLESNDLLNWYYLHEFYDQVKQNDEDDCMCPFFGLLPKEYDAKEFSDKYLQLFLSHNKGVQYYIGSYDKKNNKYLIEKNGQMSFIDNALFAPEGLYTKDGRLVSFYWQRDNLDDNLERELMKGWSGIHSLPRELFLTNDNSLGIAPLRELKLLRIPTNNKFNSSINDNCEIVISNINKEKHTKVGIRIDFGNQGYVLIYIDLTNNTLVFDLLNSNTLGRKVKDIAPIKDDVEQFLDIFIDKCMIEAFVSNKQAISRQVFEANPGERSISLINDSKDELKLEIYEMMPTK